MDREFADSPSAGVPVLDIGIEYVRLDAAIEAFATREENYFTAAEIGEQVVRLSRCIDRLKLEQARLVGVFAKTGEAEKQGSNTVTDWVRHQARLSLSDALELDVVGRHVDDLPMSREAVAEGLVGFGHLVQLARNAAFSAKSRTGAFDEAPLLPLAQQESVSRFHHTCMNARHAQDPEGYAAAEVTAVESRELNINPLDDGTTWFNIRLDNAAAALTQSVLEAGAKRLGPDDHRSRSRRLADAFVDLAEASLREFDGAEVSGRNLHLNVTCTADTLLNLPGAAAAEVEFGEPLSGATVRRLACDATITKILLDDKLVPVAVGHMKRVLSKRERKALNARDRHCRYPGCERPASQCQGHHVDWFSRTHRTRLGRTVLLCSQHHWRVHEGGWQLFLDDQGVVTVIPPQHFNLARGPGDTAAA